MPRLWEDWKQCGFSSKSHFLVTYFISFNVQISCTQTRQNPYISQRSVTYPVPAQRQCYWEESRGQELWFPEVVFTCSHQSGAIKRSEARLCVRGGKGHVIVHHHQLCDLGPSVSLWTLVFLSCGINLVHFNKKYWAPTMCHLDMELDTDTETQIQSDTA